MPARTVNVVVGIWLFISAFIWRHTGSEFTNTWICGVLAVIFAFLAMGQPQFRYLNTALGIYLFISTLAFPHASTGTMWSNLISAIVIFLVSLMPSERVVGPRRPIAT